MYKRIEPKKLTGKETFKNANKEFTILQFWQFAFSNINSNVLRGALAEFLIENVIKEPKEIKVRNPWGDFDVLTAKGTKIEVKCSAYLQDWDQTNLSSPAFSGLKAKELYWNSAVSEKKETIKYYKADLYILVLQKHKDPDTLNLLNMNQWDFYLLTKEELKDASKNGGSISLVRLNKQKVSPYHFNELKAEIEKREST